MSSPCCSRRCHRCRRWPTPDDRARVTALADRYVAEYEKNFPVSVRVLRAAGASQRRGGHQLARGNRALARAHEGDGRRARGDQAGRLRRRAGMGHLAVPRPDVRAGPVDGHLPQRAVGRIDARLAGRAAARSRACSRWARTRRGRRHLSRWRDFGPYIDREIANLTRGPAARLFRVGGRDALHAGPARRDCSPRSPPSRR